MGKNSEKVCVLGVDVGGTNTDAVILRSSKVLEFSKEVTTPDVSTGVLRALRRTIEKCLEKENSLKIQQVNIGTTHFVNAVIQISADLTKVAVLRLATPPCSQATPPFSDFPKPLKQAVFGGFAYLSGGYHVDGRSNGDLSRLELENCVKNFLENGVKNFVVSGLFSPAKPDQEIQVGEWLKQSFCGTISFTLSHDIGQIGLLQRENAAIFNECLKPLCKKELRGLRAALESQLGLTCPIYLTKNDGTICSLENALERPVGTFASGPTNSMRGAAFISGMKSGIVADIGGSSTDVGVLVDGFPREAFSQITIGGVPTNFRMPNTLSIALGGGSKVQLDDSSDAVRVGPTSLGYKLLTEGLSFGGTTLTTTDIAVAENLVPGIPPKKVEDKIPVKFRKDALKVIRKMLEDAIDQMKTSATEVEVILVGGGSVLIDTTSAPLGGCSRTVVAENSAVANAIGAALCQVSGHIDVVTAVDLTDGKSRNIAVTEIKEKAVSCAINNGADPETIQIVEFEEIPLSYLPGNAVRLKATAVGDLLHSEADSVTITKDAFLSHALSSERKNVEIYPVGPSTLSAAESGEVWSLNAADIECLVVGAGILGCGGGGNPHLGKLRILNLIDQGKFPKVAPLCWLMQNVDPSSPVIFTGFMGAPVVIYERSESGKESATAASYLTYFLNNMERKNQLKTEVFQDGAVMFSDKIEEAINPKDLPPFRKNCAGVCSFEIGGINSTEPLAVSAQFDVFCLDADGMGRAFPELQISDVSRRMEAGFNKGRMILEGMEQFSNQNFLIEFQNENLIAWDFESKMVLASVPDLICVLDTDSGLPVTTEELRYGLRVTVLVLKPDDLLTTEKALAVIGPKAFGYSDVVYTPSNWCQ